MLKYLNIYRIILKNFGFRLRPLGTFSLLGLHKLLNASTRGLDHLLCPGFKKLPIDRPVFILGNPRSGTTFVHRFLLNTEQLCAFELWEMLFPGVTARKLFGSLIKHFAPFNPARYHSSDAHETSLRDVETDDALGFLHFVDGGFLWAYYLAWEDEWDSPLCRSVFDEVPAKKEERLFRYLEGCWRRNMYAKGVNRFIVKSSIFSIKPATLVSRYPDAKLLYIARDPLATIPSGMSLLTGVLEQSYDMFKSTGEAQRSKYLENLYQASCHFYRGFHRALKAGEIPERNLKIVPYPRLMGDLDALMRELVDFCELSPADPFWDKLREQTEKQKSRKSSHSYSLEKFGLTEDRIRSDLRFVYEDFEV